MTSTLTMFAIFTSVASQAVAVAAFSFTLEISRATPFCLANYQAPIVLSISRWLLAKPLARP